MRLGFKLIDDIITQTNNNGIFVMNFYAFKYLLNLFVDNGRYTQEESKFYNDINISLQMILNVYKEQHANYVVLYQNSQKQYIVELALNINSTGWYKIDNYKQDGLKISLYKQKY